MRLLGVAVLLLSSTSVATIATPLDFTPVEVQVLQEGFSGLQQAFRDGGKYIFVEPPEGWRLTGGGNEVTCVPPAGLEGFARFSNSRVKPTIPFDESGLPKYRAEVLATLPKGAESVEVLSEAPDPFPFAYPEWKGFEIWLSYQMLGTKHTRWVVFITMSAERQICLVVDGKEKSFAKVHEGGRFWLGTWFEPPPGWSGMDNRTGH
jgi:hypothetical protein